jgi:phospholipid transport system substrate-binding protein
MMKHSHCSTPVWFVLAALLLSTWGSPLAFAEQPLDVVRSATERVLEVLREAEPGREPHAGRHRERILEIASACFDFEEMARRVLSHHWERQPREKQGEFVTLFTQLVYRTYMGRVDATTVADKKVLFGDERIDGKTALVRTRIVSSKEPEVSVDYRLRWDDGKWRIYDVVVEGISIISNYRSQFSALLTRQPFDALLERLRAKVLAEHIAVKLPGRLPTPDPPPLGMRPDALAAAPLLGVQPSGCRSAAGATPQAPPGGHPTRPLLSAGDSRVKISRSQANCL